METSSSSNPEPINGLSQEELELENLWSELHAIKKLYGLLHKNNSKISDGDGANCLDEKSRVVLKKLLDVATHQALQSQAKIVCYTPEPRPPPSEIVTNREPKTPIDKEVSSPEKLQKQHLVAAQQDKNKTVDSSVPSAKVLTPSQNPKKDPDHHRPVAGPKINPKSHPNVNRGDLTRQNSQARQSQAKIVCYTSELLPPSLKVENREPKTPIDKEAETPEKLQKCHSVTDRRDKAESTKSSIPPPDVQDKLLAAAEPKIHRKPHPIVNRGNLSRQNSQNSMVSKRLPQHHHPFRPHICHRHQDSSKSQTRNNYNQNTANTNTEIKPRQTTSGDLLAIVPAEKRARVEPTGTLVPFTSTNQTRIVGRIDRELTHSKRSDTKVRPTQRTHHEPISKIPSRMGSIKDQRTISKIPSRISSKIPSRIGSKNDRRTASKIPSGIGSKNDQRTASKTLNRMGSVKDRRTSSSIASTDHQNRKQNYRLDIIQRKPPRQQRDQIDPRPKKSTAYSSSYSTSQATQSDYSSSGISSSVKKAAPTYGSQRPQRRMPSRRKNVGPPPRAKAKNMKTSSSETKEGRLKQIKNKLAVIFLHHHHHHHIHDGRGHVVSVQDQKHRSPWTYLKSIVHHTSRGKDGDKLARARGEEKQHGYLHALLEGLIRHVWGRRRRRKGVGGKVRGEKRLHWWQRIRRRGVVRLANKKMPRLRLGFRRSHSKNRNTKG